MINELFIENNKIAMERQISFWKREVPDRILAEFIFGSDATLAATKTGGTVSKDCPPLYDNVPGMLEDFENLVDEYIESESWKIADDGFKIPIAWPELQFGNGMAGAMFGGELEVTSTKDHTYTFNKPVIKDWSDIRNIKFDENNVWVRRILDALRYFVEHSSREFVIRPFFVYEGADFIVSIRGTTQAFYDLIDNPPELNVLYKIGRDAGIKFFEMKQKLISKYNENLLKNDKYSKMAPLHSIPMLDMDAYALCSPETFERIGFENKQAILNHFGGGSFYIHAMGRFIVPIAAHLENLTELWLFDDPKYPAYFDDRINWRKETFDIPLQIYCSLKQFTGALEEKSLPGGVKYNILTDKNEINIEEANDLMDKIKKYQTRDLAGKPKR